MHDCSHLPPLPRMVLKPLMFIPLPLPPPLPAPPLCACGLLKSSLLAASACAYSLFGFLIVLSTLRIAHAASQAACNTLIRTSSGSHTNNSYMSSILPPRTLTPKCLPPSPPCACFCLSLLSTSVEFMPLFSARVLGIVSSALAKPLTTSYVLPSIPLRYSLRYLESSISMAPPPATIAFDL